MSVAAGVRADEKKSPDSNGHPSDVNAIHNDTAKVDLGFLPIPDRLQYDPTKPVHFGLLLNAAFGIASTFIVANLYYCQPLLIEFAKTFNVTYGEVSRIPTLVQAGYATGLLFISPLGDLVRRRPLILLLIVLSTTLTIGLATARSLVAFEALTFLVGLTSPVPQILIPLAADLAPAHRRAAALSIVLSGLMLGVLIARVLAGVIAQFVTYRVVYYVAVGVQGSMLLLLWAVLPDYPAKNKGVTYAAILKSMARLIVTEPLLVQAVLINMAASACLTNFWVTLTFLLGGPQYGYSTLVIGLFGLVGIVGVAMAPLVGRLIDRLVPWSATVIATLVSLVFYSIQAGGGGISIAAVVIASFGIDVTRQMQTVSLSTAVFGLDPRMRARLNSLFMFSFFLGQVMGTAAGTKAFVQHGWRASAALSVGWQGWSLLVILVRGPHCARYTWFGYEGGYELRKSVLAARERSQDVEKAVEKPDMTENGEKSETREMKNVIVEEDANESSHAFNPVN